MYNRDVQLKKKTRPLGSGLAGKKVPPKSAQTKMYSKMANDENPSPWFVPLAVPELDL